VLPLHGGDTIAWCHGLELRAEMRCDGQQGMKLRQRLYSSFGEEGVGAPLALEEVEWPFHDGYRFPGTAGVATLDDINAVRRQGPARNSARAQQLHLPRL
jgi:hypothetical protein